MANSKDFKVKNGIKPTVYHEAVGTVVSGSEGYYLTGASYDNKSFSVASQATLPIGSAIKSDGTSYYVMDNTTDTVYQYNLSTAYDISTASYASKSFSVNTQISSPVALAISADGTKMYSGQTGTIYQYTLSTAWDISTASYASLSYTNGTNHTNLRGILFKPDGTKVYIGDIGGTPKDIFQYSLSTAWDISTASYDNKTLVVTSTVGEFGEMDFNADGSKLFIQSYDNDAVYQYSLSTAYDISTGSYDSVSFSTGSQEATARGFIFGDSGTKFYIVGDTNDTIYQYSSASYTQTLDLSTGSVFEITPTSNIEIDLSNPADSGTVSQATLLLDGGAASSYDLANASYDSVSFSVSSQETSPAFVLFKTDGTKMYVGGSGNDTVYQYSLSTAWDISTASYDSVSFSVASQENNLRGLYIKPDGLKFYTIGTQADVVHQYTMSTAWDMSTASYDSVSFSVTSQEGEPQGISFKTDGTKMFVVGSIGDEVNEYSLSTAWDISTASFTTNFVISGQDTNPNDIYFKDDGTKFWISGDTNNTVYQYSCSTAWDISTASYDSVSFSVATQETGPQGLSFGNSGTKLYVVGTVNDTVFQYSTGSAATITYPSTLEWPSGTAPTSPAVGDTDVLTFSTRNGGTSYQAVQAVDGAK
jgi:DNA-binding beta-propeller fold protein YncE